MLCVGISNVISLFSGIALFLFGMALMGDGLKQVAGNKLELILYRLTGSPVKGFLLGTGVTAVIQSSSATSVMVVGFVNSGMMKVRQSISIVLGAILGTSITGWIICLSDIGSTGGWMDLFSTATLTGVISVIGIVLRMASKDPAKKHIGDILMGFAVLMFGMSTMSAAVSPLREDPTFIRILTSFSTQVGSLEPQFTYSYDAMLKIDLLLAKARLAVEQNAFMPAVSDTVHFKLNKARHPLIDKKKVVPVDIELGSEYDTLVITGPNTGGKTVTLKTIGLLAAMSGAPVVPACIVGTDRIMQKGGFLPKLSIMYGEPMHFTGDKRDKEQLEAFSQEIMAHIAVMREEIEKIS